MLSAEGEIEEPSLLTLDVTLEGVIFTAKLAMAYFRRNPLLGGALVFTASSSSYNERPMLPLYSISKHGVSLKVDVVSFWKPFLLHSSTTLFRCCNGPLTAQTERCAFILAVVAEMRPEHRCKDGRLSATIPLMFHVPLPHTLLSIVVQDPRIFRVDRHAHNLALVLLWFALSLSVVTIPLV